ncbi:hypothetical protein D3C73_1299920 [compost metagenome]
MSSTSLAVINDSRRPTSAMDKANGAMIWNVSRFRGTLGRKNPGRLSGSSPLSLTVGTLTFPKTVTSVMATIATKGAGIAVVMRGSPNTITKPTTTIG